MNKALLITGISLLVIGGGVGIYFLVRRKGVEDSVFTLGDTGQSVTPGGSTGNGSSSGESIGKYTLNDLPSGMADFDMRFINDLNEKIYNSCRQLYPGNRSQQMDCALQKIKIEQQNKGGWYAERINQYSFQQIKDAFFGGNHPIAGYTDWIITWNSDGTPMNV